MSKKVAPAIRYFVGRFKDKQGNIRHRVLRQRKVGRIIKRLLVEMYNDAWKPVKDKFVRVSNLFNSREAARREKYACEGK